MAISSLHAHKNEAVDGSLWIFVRKTQVEKFIFGSFPFMKLHGNNLASVILVIKEQMRAARLSTG